MKQEFVVLAEYDDDLEAQMVQSALFDADIDVELELEKPRGVVSRYENTVIRVMVRPHDYDRARKLLRNGAGSIRLDVEPDFSDFDTLDTSELDSSDNVHEF